MLPCLNHQNQRPAVGLLLVEDFHGIMLENIGFDLTVTLTSTRSLPPCPLRYRLRRPQAVGEAQVNEHQRALR